MLLNIPVLVIPTGCLWTLSHSFLLMMEEFMDGVTIVMFFNAEVTTASVYNPPYTPTQCYGDNAWKFPTNNLFAAAGEGIWDNGAACGRQYLVKCIGAAVPNTCIPGQAIQVTIVDQAQTSVSRPARGGVAIVLSKTAFGTIANPPATFMIIDIQPV